jgi:hypothetical protein
MTVLNCNSQWSTRGSTSESVSFPNAYSRCPFVLICMLILHTQTNKQTNKPNKNKNIYCYFNSSFFHFGLVVSTSSSCFSVSKACGNHQVQIQTIRRPLQSGLMQRTWSRRTCEVTLHPTCCTASTIRSVWLQHPILFSRCVWHLNHYINKW